MMQCHSCLPGFGNYLARPLFRDQEDKLPTMDEAAATKLLHDALKACSPFTLQHAALVLSMLTLVTSVQYATGYTQRTWHQEPLASGCCLQVCYYRDKQSINKFRIITATKAGVKLTEPFALETNWHYKVHALLSAAPEVHTPFHRPQTSDSACSVRWCSKASTQQPSSTPVFWQRPQTELLPRRLLSTQQQML
jgi:hypothetical protein